MSHRLSLLSFCATLAFTLSLFAQPALPGSPTDPQHPGSKIYSDSEILESQVTCLGRKVLVFQPKNPTGALPVVAYGHGQAMTVENDRGTLEHLAKKGIFVIYPTYDKGFFDQDWLRMGDDYYQQVDCALRLSSQTDPQAVTYAGYSKGAYVASIAIGHAYAKGAIFKPAAGWIFSPAGSESTSLGQIPSHVVMNVVRADSDRTVEPLHAQQIYNLSNVTKKQLITLKSYRTTQPALTADHFWTLSKASTWGGTGESAFHYYSLWKWLVGASQDLSRNGQGTDPYAYGRFSLEKGVETLQDEKISTF